MATDNKKLGQFDTSSGGLFDNGELFPVVAEYAAMSPAPTGESGEPAPSPSPDPVQPGTSPSPQPSDSGETFLFTVAADESGADPVPAGDPGTSFAILAAAPAAASVVTWQAVASGFWDVAANWSSNPALPGAADSVTIDQPGAWTITHRSGTDTVASLASQESLAVSGGSLAVAGTFSNAGNTTVSGGRLDLNGASTLGAYTQTAGTLGGDGAAAASGPAVLSGGLLTGSGTFTAGGGLSITGSFGLDAGKTLKNTGAATWTSGSINLNADAYAGSGTLNNAAGATFLIQGNNPSSIYASNQGSLDNGAAAVFSNAGTVRKAGSTTTDVSTISVQFTNTGALDIQSGILQLSGNSTLNGTLTVAAASELRLNGGTHALSDSANTIEGVLRLNGGTLNLAAAQTLAGAGTFVQSGGTLKGADLTVAGAAELNGGIQTGNAVTDLQGASVISGSIGLDAGRTLKNEGTATWTSGSINLNGDSFAGAGKLVNASGATWLIQGNNPSQIYASNYGAADNGSAAVLENAGTLRKADSTAVDETAITVRLVNTGTLDIASGRLSLTGSSTHNGALLTGAGTLALGGSATTTHVLDATTQLKSSSLEVSGGKTTVAGTVELSTGTAVSGGSLHLGGTVTSLGESVSLSGGMLDLGGKSVGIGFYSQSNGTLLNQGQVVIAGTGTLTGGTAAGTGSIQAYATVTLGSFGFDGGQILENHDLVLWNSGSVDLNAQYYDYGQSQYRNFIGSGRIQNDAGSLFEAKGSQIYATDRSGSVGGDDGAAARIDNAGLFRKSGSAATYVDVAFNNTGTLEVAEGTLLLRGGGSQTGTVQVAVGAFLDFAGGSHTLGSTGNSIDGALRVTSGTVNLAANQSISGLGSFRLSGGTVAGADLTVNGGFTQSGGVFKAGNLRIAGDATLSGGDHSGAAATTLQGATTVSGSFGLDAGRSLVNQGTLTWTSGYLNLNDTNAAGSGTLSNAAGATFLIQGNNPSSIDASNYGVADNGAGAFFNNAGTLRKAGSNTTDTTTLSVQFTNTGAVDVATGILSLNDGSNLGGTIAIASGAELQLTTGTHTVSGAVTLAGGGELQISSGSVSLGHAGNSLGGTLRVQGGTLDLTAAQTLAAGGGFVQTGGVLKGAALTVAGTATLSGGDHSGAAATTLQGATTVNGSFGVDAGRSLVNQGTLTWTSGSLDLNDNTGNGSGSLSNHATGIFNIQSANGYTIHASNRGSGDDGSTATFSNAGTVQKSGAGTTTYVDVDFINDGRLEVAEGTLSLRDTVTNQGAIVVNGRLTASSTFLESGEFTLQGGSASATVNSMTVESDGFLKAGAGDRLIVQDDLIVFSNRAADWSTANGTLEFTASANHDLYLTGVDLGADDGGYAGNFAWGKLQLDSGAILNLKDGNATAGAALYVGAVVLAGGTAQLNNINSDFNIYYDAANPENGYLGGQTYALHGLGHLIPVVAVGVQASAEFTDPLANPLGA